MKVMDNFAPYKNEETLALIRAVRRAGLGRCISVVVVVVGFSE